MTIKEIQKYLRNNPESLVYVQDFPILAEKLGVEPNAVREAYYTLHLTDKKEV